MPIYMKFEGITGSVTEEGHKGWIELDSCQFGVNRHVTNATGRETNREASVPSVSELVITKPTDAASSALFKASLWGEGKKIQIDFCRKEEKGKVECYLKVELENTLISSYNISGHGGSTHSQPMESLSLNFTKITYNSVPIDQGKTGGWVIGEKNK